VAASVFAGPLRVNTAVFVYLAHVESFFLQCCDAVGWVAGRASGL